MILLRIRVKARERIRCGRLGVRRWHGWFYFLWKKRDVAEGVVVEEVRVVWFQTTVEFKLDESGTKVGLREEDFFLVDYDAIWLLIEIMVGHFERFQSPQFKCNRHWGRSE
jgi:hypothetical protein